MPELHGLLKMEKILDTTVFYDLDVMWFKWSGHVKGGNAIYERHNLKLSSAKNSSIFSQRPLIFRYLKNFAHAGFST